MNKDCAGCRYNRNCFCLFQINPKNFKCKKTEMLEQDLIKSEQKEIKQKEVLDKIKEYIEENKYKKMGGYGNNEDEDIEVCLFEDDIWKLEELLEEIE